EIDAMTEVRVPGLAGGALTAPVQGHDRDAVSRLPSFGVVAEFGDDPGHLVSDNGGRADAGVHVAVIDVQVGAADPGIGDIDPDMSGRWLLGQARLEPQRARSLVHDRTPVVVVSAGESESGFRRHGRVLLSAGSSAACVSSGV